MKCMRRLLYQSTPTGGGALDPGGDLLRAVLEDRRAGTTVRCWPAAHPKRCGVLAHGAVVPRAVREVGGALIATGRLVPREQCHGVPGMVEHLRRAVSAAAAAVRQRPHDAAARGGVDGQRRVAHGEPRARVGARTGEPVARGRVRAQGAGRRRPGVVYPAGRDGRRLQGAGPATARRLSGRVCDTGPRRS